MTLGRLRTVAVATTPGRQRRRMRRWITAIALLDAAARSARIDTPETNAMALLSAHAAAETLLGLIVGHRTYKRGEDIPFPRLVQDAVDGLKRRRARALVPDLLDDLDAMHRARNSFVHAASAVPASEVEQAIGAARELAEHIPSQSTSGGGIADAIAGIIDIDYVSMWLRHADDMLRTGRHQYAADGLARALDAAIRRTHPPLVDRRDRTLSQQEERDALDQRVQGLRQVSLGARVTRARPIGLGRAIEGLSDWVLPLAIGLSPAAYSAMRSTIGYESRVDLSGAPLPVDRPTQKPTEDEVRRAAGTVGVVIFQLWASGTLRSADADPDLMRLAQSFVADPKGIAADGRPGVDD